MRHTIDDVEYISVDGTLHLSIDSGRRSLCGLKRPRRAKGYRQNGDRECENCAGPDVYDQVRAAVIREMGR